MSPIAKQDSIGFVIGLVTAALDCDESAWGELQRLSASTNKEVGEAAIAIILSMLNSVCDILDCDPHMYLREFALAVQANGLNDC